MKEKQIEEMACSECLHHLACLVNGEYVPTPCPAYEDKEGYRKQSEGEWKQVNNNYPRYVCTNCNHLFNNKNFKYCPNCGAKMKGGEQRKEKEK